MVRTVLRFLRNRRTGPCPTPAGTGPLSLADAVVLREIIDDRLCFLRRNRRAEDVGHLGYLSVPPPAIQRLLAGERIEDSGVVSPARQPNVSSSRSAGEADLDPSPGAASASTLPSPCRTPLANIRIDNRSLQARHDRFAGGVSLQQRDRLQNSTRREGFRDAVQPALSGGHLAALAFASFR